MSELHFPGNCLKGSRPILSFDATFLTQPHLLLIKELLTHIFSVPKGARKSKPFVDHVMGFTIADGKIWIRCFQINEAEVSRLDLVGNAESGIKSTNGDSVSSKVDNGAKEKKNPHERQDTTKLSLTEIGPRFVLTPIVILESSFGGPVIYENKEFVSPNLLRSELRLGKAGKYVRRREEGIEQRVRKGELGLRSGEGRRKREGDELEGIFV